MHKDAKKQTLMSPVVNCSFPDIPKRDDMKSELGGTSTTSATAIYACRSAMHGKQTRVQ